MIISSYYSAAKYGAAGDGKTNDAPAIQHAIDDCHAAGGGTVLLEGGHTYYSSSLTLRSNVNLHLEKGAVLKASSELDSYFRPNKEKKDEGVNRVGTPVTLKPSYVFLYAKDAENISVSGEGTIDGNSGMSTSRSAAGRSGPKTSTISARESGRAWRIFRPQAFFFAARGRSPLTIAVPARRMAFRWMEGSLSGNRRSNEHI